ncbi:autotransporter adhesin [Aggregatibacter actinomycetemcomitans]|uniref:autotransporter adhesin n=1 Tax=Aggregatibacter actinomycetemcomitans TaxID=714 RepID=UPI0001B9F5B2|nr:autotransporter adhesin [Aggregatibacter actinomycetemcomitans]KYK76630.1 autotransporter adhesin [Aggregatibacter actinomycetemcomitans serotype e str. SA2149]KYK81267.1 autotransporter adhesin [Aggregatibacter actinomycetemcomitans SC383s]MCE3057634.1 adhesin [Aggregatibacter actinomycetemcomitans]
MKILLKPFRYSVIATTIALVFNQPAFASEFNAQINNQPSSQAKTKSKTNIKKNMQNNISNSAKESVNTYQTEIQRITAAQKLARQKAEMAQKEAEARAIAQVKEKRQQSQIKAQELEQKKAELVQREYLEAKRQVREQEMARQKAEEDRKVAEALAAVKLKNSTQQRLTKEQLAAQKEAERLANEQEIARQKIKANELQRAINEQSKLAEVARVKRTLIEQKQVISPQKEDEILRQQAIEEQRKKEALANAERKRLEAERLAREEEIANQKAEEARKKSEELARRERDRLAREQEIARQKAVEEERQRAIEAQRQQEENARIERERAKREEADRLAREQEIARQKAVEEERQRAIEAQRQQEENARIERERAEREEADRLAREQEIAAQQVEEKSEESPVILVRSTAPTDLPSDMAPLDLEDIQGENSDVEKTITVAPKEHIEMIHDETNSETKTEDVALKVDSTLESQEVSNSQPEVAEQVVASHEETAHQLNAEETISVVKRLTTEIASAIPANLEPSVADAEVVANSEVRESEETEVAPQAPTVYNPNEILVANAIVSNVAILNTLNLDLSGRLDRKLDRTSFYRTLGGVWVEYVNSDMHGHGGDTNNYRAKSNQITLGNDEAQLDNGVVLGGTFTHAKTDNQYGPLSGKDTLTKITAYAKQNFDQYSKALDIGYGWSSSKIGNSKLKRKIISVGMNFAYDFELEDFKVTPIWGLRYHHLSSTGGEINGLNVRSPGFSLVAYHTGLKFSNTYNVDGIEVTPAFSTYYVTTLGKSYSQNINGKEFGVAIGPYWHNNASLSIGLRDWKISAYAAVNQGKHGERQNQLGVKLNYYW